MKIRAYESIVISVDGVNQIEGYTLTDWKALLMTGLKRCVRTGRNLHDWDHYLEASDPRAIFSDKWVKVPAQPDHIVDESAVEFTTFKHGGSLTLQATYYFEGVS